MRGKIDHCFNMPNVRRTPSTTPKAEVQRALSNPNIPGVSAEFEFGNKTKRSKRPRSDCSPSDEFKNFKDEMRELLNNWKSD